jgi:mannose-6-phosphate isomerase-like protein (cupin superfamily)
MRQLAIRSTRFEFHGRWLDARCLEGRKELGMATEKKSLDSPEETRTFDNGRVDLADLAGQKAGRYTLQPGWKWSEAVKPIAKTDSCQVHHVGYVVSGTLHVVHQDGTEIDVRAGDLYEVEPGHDAWVVADEPWIAVEFATLKDYAKK